MPRSRGRKPKKGPNKQKHRPATPEHPENNRTTHVRRMELPGNNVISGHFSNNGIDVAIVGDGGGDPPVTGAAVSISGQIPKLDADLWTNRDDAITGGSLGRLGGVIEHHPGADPSTVGFAAAGTPERKCKCGFAAFAFTEECSKCGRRL